MKKLSLAIAVLAMSASSAFSADLAARPYTKAPPMIAAIFAGAVVDTAKATRWGGTVGAGLEFGFAPNWSVGVEYDHIFLDSHDTTLTAVPGGGAAGTIHVRQDVDMGLVRLNYRFGGPVIAKY